MANFRVPSDVESVLFPPVSKVVFVVKYFKSLFKQALCMITLVTERRIPAMRILVPALRAVNLKMNRETAKR